TILSSPCPFIEGKQISETHVLVLIPKTVNGTPLTLNTLDSLVKAPKQGTATVYDQFWPPAQRQYGDVGIEKSYWLLMTRDVLEGSRGKFYDGQIASYAQKAQAPYE